MQIVIDIDENVFTRLFDNGIEDYAIVNDDLFAIARSIRKSTPLPKGHGRLIDADEIDHYMLPPEKQYEKTWFIHSEEYKNAVLHFNNALRLLRDNAPTIIEADTEREVEE